MKKQIKHKPLSNDEYKMLIGFNPLTDLILYTGVRINECRRLIDEWDGKSNYVDILTKKSQGAKNRIYLNDNAIKSLKMLSEFKGVSTKTIQRKITSLSNEKGIVFTAHNLRATTLTRLLENGVDLVTVQNIANHADISQTARYIKLNEGMMINAVKTLLPGNTISGMTPFEMRSEILRLRKIIDRLENERELLGGKNGR